MNLMIIVKNYSFFSKKLTQSYRNENNMNISVSRPTTI